MTVTHLSHVASRDAPTGAERSLALLARGLRERGHRTRVVVPGAWALGPELDAAGVPVDVVPSTACWLTYFRPRSTVEALARWVRFVAGSGAVRRLGAHLERERPDVVHVNCLPHLHGAAAARRVGLPVVWHLREILPPGRRRRFLAGKLAEWATRIVAVSEATAAWVREEGLGDRLAVVPNGVALPEVQGSRESARRALGLSVEGPICGLFGQLVPHKGVLEFLEAGHRVLRELPGARFLVAGPGPAEFLERIDRVIAEADSPGLIRLPAQPDASLLIEAADVVALTTTTPDPFPRAVLEAMAAARPVVAFDSGGCAEMVEDGTTGHVVPLGDVETLAARVAALLRDGSRGQELGAAGARRVRDRFSLARHVERMEAELRRAST